MESNFDKIKETTHLVRIFLETNASDLELEKRTGISSSKIGRILRDKKRILEAFPHEGEKLYNLIGKMRKQNSYNGKVLGGQISMLNYGQTAENSLDNSVPKLRLELFYKDETKQMQFLMHIALTYRAQLPLLSQFLQIPENELLEKMLSTCTAANYKSLKYLFFHDVSDQEVAKANVIEFYRDLILVLKNKDKDMQKLVLARVDDSKAFELIKSRKERETISDEFMLAMVKYQLKYSYSQSMVANIFRVSCRNYQYKLNGFLERHPEYQRSLELLSIYNESGGRK